MNEMLSTVIKQSLITAITNFLEINIYIKASSVQ